MLYILVLFKYCIIFHCIGTQVSDENNIIFHVSKLVTFDTICNTNSL